MRIEPETADAGAVGIAGAGHGGDGGEDLAVRALALGAVHQLGVGLEGRCRRRPLAIHSEERSAVTRASRIGIFRTKVKTRPTMTEREMTTTPRMFLALAMSMELRP
jgi:hypothetical protein